MGLKLSVSVYIRRTPNFTNTIVEKADISAVVAGYYDSHDMIYFCCRRLRLDGAGGSLRGLRLLHPPGSSVRPHLQTGEWETDSAGELSQLHW